MGSLYLFSSVCTRDAVNVYPVKSQAAGRNLLYFGCRRREQDFLYRWQLGTFQCLVHSFYSDHFIGHFDCETCLIDLAFHMFCTCSSSLN